MSEPALSSRFTFPAHNRIKRSPQVIRPRNEHSIAAECEVIGRGYWSGTPICVRFRPGSAGTGVRFVRTDLPGSPGCPANSRYGSGQSMRTNLQCGDATFQMVEHVMAALYALEIDNCIVETDAEELPGLDGSSGPYVDALQSVGLIMQATARKRFIVDRVIRVGDTANWIEVSPPFRDCASFEYRLDYGDSSPIKQQAFTHLLTPNNFVRELATARTFVTASQAHQLRTSGVGGHVSNSDLLVFADDGSVVGNSLRFANECARHKALDLIGDLAMAGVDLIGRFVSYRGGHRLNGQMAAMLAKFATGSNMTAGTGSQSAPPISLRSRAA